MPSSTTTRTAKSEAQYAHGIALWKGQCIIVQSLRTERRTTDGFTSSGAYSVRYDVEMTAFMGLSSLIELYSGSVGPLVVCYRNRIDRFDHAVLEEYTLDSERSAVYMEIAALSKRKI